MPEFDSTRLSTLVWFTLLPSGLAYPSTTNPSLVTLEAKMFGNGGLTIQAWFTFQHKGEVWGCKFCKNVWTISLVAEQPSKGFSCTEGFWVRTFRWGLWVSDAGMPLMTADWDINEEEFETPGVTDCKSSCPLLWSLEPRSDAKGTVSSTGKGNVEERLAIFLPPNATLSIKLLILAAWAVSSLYGMVIVSIHTPRIALVWYERAGCGESKIRKKKSRLAIKLVTRFLPDSGKEFMCEKWGD